MRKHILTISVSLALVYLFFFIVESKDINRTSENNYLRAWADEALKIDSIWIKDPKNTVDRWFDQMLNSEKTITNKFLVNQKIENFLLRDRNNNLISMNSLEGSWVLINVWTSWCKPCIGDIEPLKLLKKKFEDYDITFVGICIDNIILRDKWLNVLYRKDPQGIQLFAGSDGNKFVKWFGIDVIPRYILINPEGIITDIDLPRPYSLEMTSSLKYHLENFDQNVTKSFN